MARFPLGFLVLWVTSSRVGSALDRVGNPRWTRVGSDAGPVPYDFLFWGATVRVGSALERALDK